MTIDQQHEFVKQACKEQDPSTLDLIARGLWEAEEAKQVLREKGYGWTGLGIRETCQLVPTNDE